MKSQLLVDACVCTYVNVFLFSVRVFEIPGRLADNEWKCSPSTAAFNWSNRPKWARSCCPNNEALCSLSLSAGRSMWNNNTLLHISAPTTQQHFLSSLKEHCWSSFSTQPHKPAITAEQKKRKIHTLICILLQKKHIPLLAVLKSFPTVD